MFQKQQPDIADSCTKNADVQTTITASSGELPLAAVKDYRLITLYLSTNLFGNIYFKQTYTMEQNVNYVNRIEILCLWWKYHKL